MITLPDEYRLAPRLAKLAALVEKQRAHSMSITTEIGGLGQEPGQPTENEIIAFCDNLRESMLRQFREGQALSIEQKYDNQTEYTEYGMPPDAVCMGVTISVHFGRPALRSKAAEALGRAVAKRARRRAARPVEELRQKAAAATCMDERMWAAIKRFGEFLSTKRLAIAGEFVPDAAPASGTRLCSRCGQLPEHMIHREMCPARHLAVDEAESYPPPAVDEPLAEATPRLVLTVTDDAEDYPVEGDDVPPAKAETWRDRPPLL